MTDEKTKPMRRRCENCKITYFNDPIDQDSHTRYCSVLLVRRIEKLEKALKSAEETAAATPSWDPNDVINDSETTEALAEQQDADDDDFSPAADQTPAPEPEPEPEPATFSPAIDRDDDYFTSPTRPLQ